MNKLQPHQLALIACKAARTTTQSINNATATAVQFNATDTYDTASLHDPASNNTRITVPTGKAGVWRFVATVAWATNSTGYRQVEFKVSGASTSPASIDRVPANETSPQLVTVDLLLTAGQYVELFVTQTSGGALNLSGAALSAQFLGTT